MAEIFRRVEKKYIINKEQFEQVQEIMKNKMVEDSYGKSKICNVYFDTANYDLISHSIQKPVYKDKIRLRSQKLIINDGNVYVRANGDGLDANGSIYINGGTLL